MEFEWDENKNEINLDRHGISFQEAIHVFFDDLRVEYHDISSEEERFNVIGVSHGRILFVVYTWRDMKIRVISARKAEKYEEKEYYKHFR